MKFNLKAFTEPINQMQKQMQTMTQEKREETAIKMWYGTAQFKGVTIGLETIWQGIIKKVTKTKKLYKEQKLTEKELKVWKKFMLKKVYPNTEKSKPFRIQIENIELDWSKDNLKVFDILLKDIKESKQDAYNTHMDHWCGTTQNLK